MKIAEIPKDGLEGLRQNWTADALSGFLVFLLALPLSLGIAKASQFPAAMGVLTAMIGGIFVSFLAGSKLTIKGPAAGLITICAGAVTEMGGGDTGWHLALGVIVVAAAIQIVFGLLKFGSLSDFFPHSAVHGMLAAIGLIIFSKQIHVLLGIDPATLKGMEPIELYQLIPHSIMHADPRVVLVGMVSLVIIFGMPFLNGKIFKRIPAPMMVLVITIPMAVMMDFKHTEPAFDLVKIGDFWTSVGYNADFSAIGGFTFWKYVFMFLFVNSLESLLTVKAIDSLDPWKRVSNPNKDLVAVGAGNALSGLLGGLPMISEVARSSANVNFGGRTRWANFFHGFFLLVAMVLFIPVIEMIPNSALAALLIAVGYRLASPKAFIGTYKIGPEQLVIFVVTIIITIASDLLMGVAAGILVKLVFHILNGAPLGSLFKAQYDMVETGDAYRINIKGSATFSNFLGHKKLWGSLKPGKKLTFNFSEAKLVDHSFMEQLHHLEEEYLHAGGNVSIVGLEKFNPFSGHPLAARKVGGSASKIEIQLTPRQVQLRKFADANEYNFYPQKVRNAFKYKDFPIQKGNRILYEESILESYKEIGKIDISDLTLTEGARPERGDTRVTVVFVTETDLPIPDFALEPEGLWSKVFEHTGGKDIDFHEYPKFSKKYYLRGDNETTIRELFSETVIRFFENREEMHVECHKHRLLIYKIRDLLEPIEIQYAERFAEDFLQAIIQRTIKTVQSA